MTTKRVLALGFFDGVHAGHGALLKACRVLADEKGCKAGLALDPDTPIEDVLKYLPLLDLVLVMTVKSGFGGQKFRPDLLGKVEAVYAEAKKQGRDDLIIQVDGGINPETIALASAAGANCFVAGSAVFDKDDYQLAISSLRSAAEKSARA